MNKIALIQIIIIIILTLRVLRLSKTLKYSERIAKYTVNKNKKESLSLGDKLLNVYINFQNSIVNILQKSVYFKNKAIKYERYSYIDSPLKLIANKFLISFSLGVVYILSSFINLKFDIFILLLVMVIGYFIYNIYLIIDEKKRNKNIQNDLSKAIIIMNNAFKSGYNITQAIDFVSKDLNGPISEEFKKISSDLKYGLEIKDVFARFYSRVRIEDALILTSSLSLLNITGGNLIGIFSSIEKSFTNRKRLRDELNAMTSSSKLVFYILLIMPFIIISMLLFLNPEYYSPIVHNPLGVLICMLATILYISYIAIIRKILKVDAWKTVL